DAHVDVCIIGAGYSGLWTAYYLKKLDPSLDILVVEKEFAGFGASGRNGGWLTGGFAWSHRKYLAGGSADSLRRMVRQMAGSVDEVIAVAESEGIDADIVRTDELLFATNRAQWQRAKEELDERLHWGETPDRLYLIDAGAAKARINIPGTLGALVVGGVARIQPAKLVRGLADAVERMGVRIVEGTAVTGISPGRVKTARGEVRAANILRTTEGFTASLPGLRREWLPLNSAQIITEPVPPDVWDEIGWQGHEIAGDFKNSYCYCQRTREGRIAVGARGTPYKFGSAIDDNGTPDPGTVAQLVSVLHRHFPAARGLRIDHAWCGVLGVPRDWCATVGFDAKSGTGWAGGYVGVGVSTSNLAGRTLADLVLGRQTELVDLPWVNRQVRKWEFEPLRWLGVHTMYQLYKMADDNEAKGLDSPSRLAGLANWLTGR
ncbi:MAG TPA: FAD-dependent oxidoreductase, partial [Rhizobiales bacterium]|nr:FAD-dependent oxidoreductase [Hyphomicrobiales bacterium]